MGPSKSRWNGDRRQPFETAMKAKQRSTAKRAASRSHATSDDPWIRGRNLVFQTRDKSRATTGKNDVKVPKMYFKSANRARSTSRGFTDSA